MNNWVISPYRSSSGTCKLNWTKERKASLVFKNVLRVTWGCRLCRLEKVLRMKTKHMPKIDGGSKNCTQLDRRQSRPPAAVNQSNKGVLPSPSHLEQAEKSGLIILSKWFPPRGHGWLPPKQAAVNELFLLFCACTHTHCSPAIMRQVIINASFAKKKNPRRWKTHRRIFLKYQVHNLFVPLSRQKSPVAELYFIWLPIYYSGKIVSFPPDRWRHQKTYVP